MADFHYSMESARAAHTKGVRCVLAVTSVTLVASWEVYYASGIIGDGVCEAIRHYQACLSADSGA